MGKGPAILRIARLQKERPLSVIQGSRGATVLVGMPGFVVGAHNIVATVSLRRPSPSMARRHFLHAEPLDQVGQEP